MNLILTTIESRAFLWHGVVVVAILLAGLWKALPGYRKELELVPSYFDKRPKREN